MNDYVNRIAVTLGMLALALLTTGCGGPEAWKVHTHQAEGKITINGEAPVNAIIILKSLGAPIDARHTQPWGEVQQDGSYQLTTYRYQDGAPSGTYAVTLFWPTAPGSDTDRLNEKFTSIETAVAQVEIKSGNNTLPEIKLEGIKLAKKNTNPETNDLGTTQ